MRTNSTRPMAPADWNLLAHFKPAEFKVPEKMGFEFMIALDLLAHHAGVPIRITSSFRTKAHNKAVGGAVDSAHVDGDDDGELCEAVDIAPADNAERFEIVRAAMVLGWTRCGIYKDGSLHFDGTDGRRPARRLWVIVGNPA